MALPKNEAKYQVRNLAEDLGIEPASVRVALRKQNVPKNENNMYGWNKQDEYKSVLSQLRSAGKSDGDKKASKKSDDKPAAKSDKNTSAKAPPKLKPAKKAA